jgi:flagellar L-ring protein FlgH
MRNTGRAGPGRLLAGVALASVLWASAALAQSAPGSWTTDRRTFQVGDVISVLLNEYTMASANRNVSADQERSRRMAASASLEGVNVGSAGAQTEQTARSRDRGQNTRHDRLAGEMTVRVVEVNGDGLLRVEGSKMVQIDNHEQELKLTGWIRPEDVPSRNVVESWRIADASIQYVSAGRLSSPRGGILGRLLGWLWP